MANNKDRYCISYVDTNGKWSEVYAKVKKEALALYDVVSGEQIKQT